MELSDSQESALFAVCFADEAVSGAIGAGQVEPQASQRPLTQEAAPHPSSISCPEKVMATDPIECGERARREEMQRLARPLAAFGHTLRPPQQGQRVAVIGDGWGGTDCAGYEALVTEADYLTYTVVALGGPSPWAESHVLKSCCVLLDAPPVEVGHRHHKQPASGSMMGSAAGSGVSTPGPIAATSAEGGKRLSEDPCVEQRQGVKRAKRAGAAVG